MTSNSKSTKIWFWTSITLSWVTVFSLLTSPIGFIFWSISLTILIIRKSNLKWYLIGLSAWIVIPTFSFVSGTRDYLTGNARFRYVGEMDPEQQNLNEKFRVWVSSTGCVVRGYEPLTNNPNNFAVKLWTNLFGFQKGVYTGKYPDRTKTSEILEQSGQFVKIRKNEICITFNYESKNIQLDNFSSYELERIDTNLQAKFSNIEGDYFIFNPETEGEDKVTFLADKKTGSVFARYYSY